MLWKEHTWSWKTAPWNTILFALALFYETLVLFRLWLYRRGYFHSYRPPVPVISVGNLSVGGTGKTPVVSWITAQLQRNQHHPIILTRGYQRESKVPVQRLRWSETPNASPTHYGDEALLLASRHPEVPLYVGAERAESARMALIHDKPQCFILDDGFQHLAIERDLNLLLIDAARGLGSQHLIPFGPLREPAEHWKRADAIIITKANLGFSDKLLHQLRTELNVDCPIFKFDYHPLQLQRLDRQVSKPMDALKHKQLFLSCGIADPESFASLFIPFEATIQQLAAFNDHYAYPKDIVKQLEQHYESTHPDCWVTTEKDAVKLQQYETLHDKVWFVEMQVFPEETWTPFFQEFLARFHS